MKQRSKKAIVLGRIERAKRTAWNVNRVVRLVTLNNDHAISQLKQIETILRKS